jgi:hypothetical protein
MQDVNGIISKLSSYYGIITFYEDRQIGTDSYNVKRSIPFFSNNLSQYSVGDEVSFSITNSRANGGNLKIRGQSVQFATNVSLTDNNTEEQFEEQTDFYELINNKITPSPNLTDELSLLNFLKLNNLRYSQFNEIVILSNLIDGQITIAEFQTIIDYDIKFKEFTC